MVVAPWGGRTSSDVTSGWWHTWQWHLRWWHPGQGGRTPHNVISGWGYSWWWHPGVVENRLMSPQGDVAPHSVTPGWGYSRRWQPGGGRILSDVTSGWWHVPVSPCGGGGIRGESRDGDDSGDSKWGQRDTAGTAAVCGGGQRGQQRQVTGTRGQRGHSGGRGDTGRGQRWRWVFLWGQR